MQKIKRSYVISQTIDPEKKQSPASEIQRLLAELTITKNALKDFFYLALHDLKAPLNAIDNLTNWLVEDIGADVSKDSLNHLTMVKSRTKRVKLFVNDLLLYSQVGNEVEKYEINDFQQTVMLSSAQANANQFKQVIAGCDPSLRNVE